MPNYAEKRQSEYYQHKILKIIKAEFDDPAFILFI